MIDMKNKAKKVILVIEMAVIFIAAILCCTFIPTPKPSEIFQDNLYSIVEIKAIADDIGESFGTAEFIDDEGILLTNAHVVTYMRLGATHIFDEYYIRFATEKDYRQVELLKYDVIADIALLKLNDTACEFRSMKIGNSSKLKSGDTVYAIGNAVNYGLSISKGIVGIPLMGIEYSGNTRTVIQCDLTIAEGNSGGALLDERGRLVGLTTFRTKDGAGNVVYGLAYCIPIDIVMEYIGR